KDKDVIVLFNSGGWGLKTVEMSPGWRSILGGIESELDNLGYTSVQLNYRRTNETLRGCINEFAEAITHYPSKAKDLASRVEFLTDYLPDLRVIVAGESNGTIISDCVMSTLRDNLRVYSIQTGPPFWHKSGMLDDRTLVLKSNGVSADSFSQGDIPTMLWGTVKGWLGLTGPGGNPGKILFVLEAPGHDYSWQYPKVSSQIVKFLDTKFGIK
ncbi:hypothetical protein ACFLWG_04615, partial [Chloroflexota bacterium]